MDRIEKVCAECGSRNTVEPTSGLGGIAKWKVTCNECGTETEGFRSQEECKPGEAFTDVTIFD